MEISHLVIVLRFEIPPPTLFITETPSNKKSALPPESESKNSTILTNFSVLTRSDEFGNSLKPLSFTMFNHAPNLAAVGGIGMGEYVSINFPILLYC